MHKEFYKSFNANAAYVFPPQTSLCGADPRSQRIGSHVDTQ